MWINSKSKEAKQFPATRKEENDEGEMALD